MPATETYWRSLKKLHVWFAVTAVALLLVTFWMMADDHGREYFKYQRTFYDLEALKAQAKIDAVETEAYKAEVARLREAVREAEKDVNARSDVIEPLEEERDDAQLKFSLAENELKILKSRRDVAKANRDLAVRDEKSPEVISELQSAYESLQTRVDEQTLEVERLKAALDEVQAKLDREKEDLTTAKAALNKKLQEVELLRKTKLQLRPESWLAATKRDIMEWPILQGFNSHLHIHQDWLPDLPITLGMTQTARFDRCRTCHLGSDLVEVGNVPKYPHGTITQKEADEFNAARKKTGGADVEEWGRDDPRLWVALNKFPQPYATHPNPDLYMTSTSPHPVSTYGCTICHDGNGSGTSFQNAEHGPGNPYEAKQWKEEYHYHANHFWEYPMKPGRTLESTCLKCHHHVEELGAHPKHGNSAPKVFSGYRLIQQYGCFGCHEIHGYEGDKSIGPDLRLEPNYTAAAQQFRWLVNQNVKVPESKANGDKKPANGKAPVLPSKEYDEFLDTVINTPGDSAEARAKLVKTVQKALAEKTKALADLAKEKGLSQKQRAARRQEIEERSLPRDAVALLDQFKDAAHPGTYRKVGPSLRYVKSKTSRKFIRYWTEEPKRFRPSTRMPQFFKLTNLQDAHGQQLSQVELSAIAQYLYDKSQDIELLSPAKDYKPNAEDGKLFFEQKGCLACHSHKSAPGATADFGPDLSKIAAKIKRNSSDPNDPGFQFSDWLYTWLREPQRYHKRSKMPHLFLSTAEDVPIRSANGKQPDKKQPAKKQPEKKQPAKKQPDGKIPPSQLRKADVAADITAFLLKASDDEQLRTQAFDNHADSSALIPEDGAKRKRFLERVDELTKLYLRKALTQSQVDLFYRSRKYPLTDLAKIKGDEIEFAAEVKNAKPNDEQWQQLKLRYLGRRTISRYGCYACHDVPGFERARPIGTTLQDWGRKENTKLAFEHMAEYLQHHGEPDGSSTLKRAKQAVASATSDSFTDKKVKQRELGVAYFVDQIMHHNRPGFLWQKLRQPRSYDYEKIETKGYDERLRMPKFPFDEEEIEQVATFVLGLVAEPPPHEYQYKPADAALARVEGERLLNKYNCTGCHMVELPRIELWQDLSQRASVFHVPEKPPAKPPRPKSYGHEMLNRLMPPREVDTSQTRTVEVNGKKVKQTRVAFHGLRVFTPEELPTNRHYFHNFEHLAVKGEEILPGSRLVSFTDRELYSMDDGRGGAFAEWLFQYLKDRIRSTKPNGKLATNESDPERHRVPPVLYREGYKVQTPWLYRFLLDPHEIRPMTVLRMPQFNMSSADARTLANYFAAVDGVPFPYQEIPQRRPEYIERQQQKHAELYADAAPEQRDYLTQSWKMLVTATFACRGCHAVGGYDVQKDPNSKDAAVFGPNLKYSPDRMRPDWLYLWLANPKWVSPYTLMPVNFTPPPVAALEGVKIPGQPFMGQKDVQLQAVRDALMNYHRLLEEHRDAAFGAGKQPPTKPAPMDDRKQPKDRKKNQAAIPHNDETEDLANSE